MPRAKDWPASCARRCCPGASRRGTRRRWSASGPGMRPGIPRPQGCSRRADSRAGRAGGGAWGAARAGWGAAGRGSLAGVGVGMMLGARFAPRGRSHVEQADLVFALVSDPVVELWLQRMRPDLRSLQPFYGDGSAGGKSRRESYAEMVEALLAGARAGKAVCGVFYGHPGVFAEVPHRAIARARAEGIRAHMEPGISAEDCLYADLGFDPGTVGCQHYETSQFMFYERRIDPSAWLVLWQVGIAG